MAVSTDGVLTRERVLGVVLLGATAVALYACFLILRPLLPALAWALALTIAGFPIHQKISERVKRRGLAAALSVTVVAIVLIGPAVFVANRLAHEAMTGYEQLKAETEGGKWKSAIAQHPKLGPLLEWVESHVDLEAEVKRAGEALSASLGRYLKASLWAVTQLAITLFIVFYFFRDHRAMLEVVRGLVPLSYGETEEVFGRVVDTLYATIYGTIGVSMLQGALGGLMFWWLGLNGALLWGVVMAIVSTIPVLGSYIIWGPAAVMLAVQGHLGKAAILAAWGAGVIGTLDNILYPVLVGKRIRMHTLPVFLAIVGGLMVFGAVGLVLGPLVFALTVALLDIWRRRTADGKTAEEGLRREEQVRDAVGEEVTS
jgi:predicted PurR-regulated permease PerM